jgi:hypothetical protein
MISDEDEAVRIAEWERTQQDTFDQREDRRGRANAESQCEHDCEGESRRLPKSSQCEAEMLFECVHAFPPLSCLSA